MEAGTTVGTLKYILNGQVVREEELVLKTVFRHGITATAASEWLTFFLYKVRKSAIKCDM